MSRFRGCCSRSWSTPTADRGPHILRDLPCLSPPHFHYARSTNARFNELSSALRYTEQRWHRTPSAHFPSRKLDQNVERTPRRAPHCSRRCAPPLHHCSKSIHSSCPFQIAASTEQCHPSALDKLLAQRRHHTWHAVLAATGSRLARPTGIPVLYSVCPYEVHQNRG
jgi:hypothetical protein